MPWQTDGSDVALEVDSDGLFAYGLVIITVPRQAGKTALTLATALHRGLILPAGRIWYTAQTGIKAREQFIEMIEVVERSPFRSITDCKRGAGDTRIDVPSVGSRLKAHPPTGDYLHGNQSDLNLIDEGWFFSEPDAAALMGAITPTQLTRPNPQTIIVSTMGTADSTWFHGLVDAARAGQPGVCLIEYGITDDVDPEDIDAVAAAHPAVGFTCDVQAIRDARAQLSAGEFARAYGNRRTAAVDRAINVQAWRAAAGTDPGKFPPDAHLALGAASAIDGEVTAIVAAAVVAGIPVVEFIEQRPGTSWAPARLEELSERHGNAPIVLDPNSPAGPIASALADHHALHRVDTEELTSSCADVYERIHRVDLVTGDHAPAVRFRPHPVFDAAADNAARRFIGDRWAWSRRKSAGSVAALEAGTLAAGRALHMPESVTPEVYFA
ncbi:terminase large subunit [Gordonia phage EricDab]|uniref:Terminase n=1 Tax=Gordonia phage EricDab TaxID=3070616 RepID=A0A4D6E3C7_9CAUD|nr:terminase large subunit [Gordonia phage EricDab]QBZ73173.1 terminase [Gordonia phage EricDab]